MQQEMCPFRLLCYLVGTVGHFSGYAALKEGVKSGLGPLGLTLSWWNGFGSTSLTTLMQSFVVMYAGTLILRQIKCMQQHEVLSSIMFRYIAIGVVLPKGDPHSSLRITNSYYLLGTIALIVTEQAIRSSRPYIFSADNKIHSFFGLLCYLTCAILAFNSLDSAPDESDLKSYPMVWYYKLRVYYVIIFGVVNSVGFLFVLSKSVTSFLMRYDLCVDGLTSTISEGVCCIITLVVHCKPATTEPDYLSGIAFLVYAFLRREAIPDRTLDPLGSAITYWCQVRYLQQLPVSVPSNDTCPICLDPLVEETPILPCGHAAHRICLRQWIFQHPKCPFCNQPVLFTRWHNHDVCSNCPTGRVKTWCTLCGEPTCENCIRRVSPTAVCCTKCYQREIDSGASRSLSRSVSAMRDDLVNLAQRSIPRSRTRSQPSRAPSVTAADESLEPRLPSRSPDR
eukprot:TRINITY_DN25121_c0_g1_i1.p1 TRINITY_DN25121_c0_g1~~TRINITY_DN25121_c0_g1_i1.p1  ORF type:complete len:464 (+),score=22.72 TRINITY_DN25121_c0_g1_i1:39-1394(+)